MKAERTYRISDWPEDERPRERLLKYGADTLADAELLAILLRTGNRESTAVDLARQLLRRAGGLRGLDRQSPADLAEERGIGPAKAALIKAALEIGKRIVQQSWNSRDRIRSSEEAYRYIHLRLRDLSREEFRVLFLTGRNELIGEKVLFTGSLHQSVVSPREIILHSLQNTAASIILFHNHPSGDPSPSAEDRLITQKICTACRYCDISVLDHIIVGKDTYFSFADQGLMPDSSAD
ncbi:DNA repair protein RadC [candidate division KSB1 bacterium]|nr:DNA repair protein RadC [candidate division KSB1 bacterium]